MYKTGLALLFGVLISSNTFSQNVTIEPYNFKMSLLLNPSLNTSGDAEIQESEALVYTGLLNAGSDTIRNASFLQYFPEITEFYSKIFLASSIDVTNNTKLKELSILGTDSMTSINLSNNTELTYLSISKTGLVSLDLTNNSKIKDLMVYNNELTVIDLPANDQLTSMQCSDNNITSLDVSNCSMLRGLHCSGNSLTELDVSNNIKLSWLSCGNNLLESLIVYDSLSTISCSNNQLTSLDLSGNDNLYQLQCDSNNLTHVNIQNGNNMSFSNSALNTKGNPQLASICVDNAFWSEMNWINNKDPWTSFSMDCITSIEEIEYTTVISKTYYNMMGQIVRPLKGLYIVKTETNKGFSSKAIYLE